jgi:hypothetical protein
MAVTSSQQMLELFRQRQRKERQALKLFDDLRAEAHDFSSPLTLPGGGKLYASVASAVASPTTLCSVNGQNIGIPAVAADEIVPLGYFEKGATVTAVYNASTINLYVGGPLGERFLIATKTV